jgi:hypothetical protein
MFCKHDWKVLSEITTKSKIEHALAIGANVTRGNGFALERKHILVIKCTKCGKLKRYVEEI